jgi:hypothetical protein
MQGRPNRGEARPMIAPTQLDGAGRRDHVLDVLAETRRAYVLTMQRMLLRLLVEHQLDDDDQGDRVQAMLW